LSKPSLGPWRIDKLIEIQSEDGIHVATVRPTLHWNERANAALIAEAGTVYHETGRTPRQLADERAEAIQSVDDLLDTLRAVWTESAFAFNKLPEVIAANAVIAKSKGGAA
jgi:phage shock protein A